LEEFLDFDLGDFDCGGLGSPVLVVEEHA
jgi:hypothetical protein